MGCPIKNKVRWSCGKERKCHQGGKRGGEEGGFHRNKIQPVLRVLKRM